MRQSFLIDFDIELYMRMPLLKLCHERRFYELTHSFAGTGLQRVADVDAGQLGNTTKRHGGKNRNRKTLKGVEQAAAAKCGEWRERCSDALFLSVKQSHSE